MLNLSDMIFFFSCSVIANINKQKIAGIGEEHNTAIARYIYIVIDIIILPMNSFIATILA